MNWSEPENSDGLFWVGKQVGVIRILCRKNLRESFHEPVLWLSIGSLGAEVFGRESASGRRVSNGPHWFTCIYQAELAVRVQTWFDMHSWAMQTILEVGHAKKSYQHQKSKGMPESVYVPDGRVYAVATVVSLSQRKITAQWEKSF